MITPRVTDWLSPKRVSFQSSVSTGSSLLNSLLRKHNTSETVVNQSTQQQRRRPILQRLTLIHAYYASCVSRKTQSPTNEFACHRRINIIFFLVQKCSRSACLWHSQLPQSHWPSGRRHIRSSNEAAHTNKVSTSNLRR